MKRDEKSKKKRENFLEKKNKLNFYLQINFVTFVKNLKYPW